MQGNEGGHYSDASRSVFHRWAEVQRRVLAVFQRFGPPSTTPPDMEFVRRWTEKAHPDLAREHVEAEHSLRAAMRQELARRDVPSIVPASRYQQVQAENDYLSDAHRARGNAAELAGVVQFPPAAQPTVPAAPPAAPPPPRPAAELPVPGTARDY